MKGFSVFLYNSSTVLYQQPKGHQKMHQSFSSAFVPQISLSYFSKEASDCFEISQLPSTVVSILTASLWLSREPRELPLSSTPYFPPWTQDCLPGYGGGGSWRLACNFSIQKHFCLHFPISPGATVLLGLLQTLLFVYLRYQAKNKITIFMCPTSWLALVLYKFCLTYVWRMLCFGAKILRVPAVFFSLVNPRIIEELLPLRSFFLLSTQTWQG